MAERTFFTRDSKFALKSTDANKPGTLVGYAIVWGALSSDRGGYRVRLQPGSARFAAPVLAIRGHNYNDVLGSTANGTLRLSSDDVGVRVEIDLPDTQLGRDISTLVKRGDVTGMSFSMMHGPERHRELTEGAQRIMVVEQFTVDEVTITAIPAFVETSIGHKVSGPAYTDPRTQRQRFEAMRLA